MPSSGDNNYAEISAEIPSGTGEISLSIQRAGASNQILGPNGWQSADYWFSSKPSEIISHNIGWFKLPSQVLKHITYSNYSILCRRNDNNSNTRSILTGGDLVSRPSQDDQLKVVLELPPLPFEFSKKIAESITAMDKTSASTTTGKSFSTPIFENQLSNNTEAHPDNQMYAHTAKDSHELTSSMPPSTTTTSYEVKKEQNLAASIFNETSENNTAVVSSKKIQPIILSLVFFTLLILFGLYFTSSNQVSTKSDEKNSQASESSTSGETTSTTKIKNLPEVVNESQRDSKNSQSSSDTNRKNTNISVSNSSKPLEKTAGDSTTDTRKKTTSSDKPQSANSEKSPSTPDKPQSANSEKSPSTPDKPQSSSPSGTDLNILVKEALKH